MKGLTVPMRNLLLDNPEGEILHWCWVYVRPETTRLGLFCPLSTPVFIRLTPHEEKVFFVHYTHTALCLCSLAEVRKIPGVVLQLQVPPPYSLIPAMVTEDDFQLWVLRRSSWLMDESPVAQDGWHRPSVQLEYSGHQFLLNHCAPGCPNFV